MQVSKFEKIVASEDIVSSKSIYSVNGVYSSDQICGESICSGGDIHATATISSDCLFAWNTIASQVGNISTASGNIIASAGRVEASNLCSNGVVHSDGLICGANLGTSGNVDVGGNIIANDNIYACSGIHADGLICGGNICSNGVVYADGLVCGSILGAACALRACEVYTSYNITTGHGDIFAQGGRITANSHITSCYGDIKAQNGLVCGTDLGATGNISAGGKITATTDMVASCVCGTLVKAYTNVCSRNTIYANGLVCGADLGATGNISAGGNSTARNMLASCVCGTHVWGTLFHAVVNVCSLDSIHADGLIRGANLCSNGVVCGTLICGSNISTFGIICAGAEIKSVTDICANQNVYANNVLVTSSVSVGNNIEVGNHVCGSHIKGTLFCGACVVVDQVLAGGLVCGANLGTPGDVLVGGRVSALKGDIHTAGGHIIADTGRVEGFNLCSNGVVYADGLVCGANLGAVGKLCAHDLGITGGNIIVSGGDICTNSSTYSSTFEASSLITSDGDIVAGGRLESIGNIKTNSDVIAVNNICGSHVIANQICGAGLVCGGNLGTAGVLCVGGRISSLGNICAEPGACIISEFIISEDVVCAANAILTNGIVCIGGHGSIDVYGTGSIIVNGTGNICSAGIVCAGSLYGSGVGIDDLIADQVLADPYSDASSSSGQPFTVQNAIEDLDTRLDEFETIAGVSGSGGTICVCNGIVVGVSA